MRQALDNKKLKTVYNRVAQRYDLQHCILTANSDRRGREILTQKTVTPGATVLDLGAGTGATGLSAAQRLGTSGKVILFDASEKMLAVARKKAKQTQLQDRIEFTIGDMLNLPFEDNRFDVVLSTYSMCPVYDPAKAVQEAYRVTKSGGHIGVAHSTDPDTLPGRWLADMVESIVWHFPSISLGCRSVAVLPELERLGCRIVFKKHIGVPLWPFLVIVAEKSAP